MKRLSYSVTLFLGLKIISESTVWQCLPKPMELAVLLWVSSFENNALL